MSKPATPAIAAVQAAGVRHTLHQYAVSLTREDYGLAVAQALAVEPGRVFKTLVAKVDTNLVCAVLPVEHRLDPKALARAAGGRQAALAERGEAERRTGYVRGGISPLGQRQSLPVFVDASALAYETILVSAGKRGLQLELAPLDLVHLASARVAPIVLVQSHNGRST